jgi:hypothetical protein
MCESAFTLLVQYGVRIGQYHTMKMYGVEVGPNAFFISAVNQGTRSASPPLLYPEAWVATARQEIATKRKASDTVEI